MPEKDAAPEIKVDLTALRQAKAERALSHDSVEIFDYNGKLRQLPEFSILSAFARRKNQEH
ncbi:MAG: hypothetical protein EXR10_03660 [Alphaproteobacteria bacterium]|nr:hypothetical protein [Alphaproteobacteria bacterium]PHY00947.1 MAG: hypothetical protein CK529_02750 [Rhodospirillaceae bacterium]